jgi:hypothetical protein
MRKSILFWALLLIVVPEAYSQLACNPMMPRGGDMDWGTGAYYLPESFQAKVYSSQDGSYYGTMVREPQSLRVVARRNEWRRVAYSDQEWIGHHRHKCLKVKPAEDEAYVEVLWKTFEEPKFMKKEELEATGAVYYDYADYLLKEQLELPAEVMLARRAGLGINITKWCVPLFESGDDQSEMIKCIYGNKTEGKTYSELKILEFKDGWARVKVLEWQSDHIDHPTAEECKGLKKEVADGWMKVINEKGFPLIWFAVGY